MATEVSTLKETDCLKITGDILRDESIASTRRMVAMVTESEQTGESTLEVLRDQGERLERASAGLLRLDDELEEARAELDSAGCMLCRLLRSCFGKGGKPRGEDAKKARRRDSKELYDLKDLRTKAKSPTRTQEQSGDAIQSQEETVFPRIGDDGEREEELEECFSQVAAAVSNLKTICLTMGEELDTQNEKIDIIKEQTEKTDTAIAEISNKAGKILK